MSTAKFADTMIGSKNLQFTVDFYKKFLGMEVSNPGDGKSFIILKDSKTDQTLCIVADPSIQNAVPSIESENLELTLKDLLANGGTVTSQDQYPTMKTANVLDPDGRKLLIWETLTT